MLSHPVERHAYTVLELLLVMAVVSLLSAILFSVLHHDREDARRLSCQSNLKQIGLGMMQYMRDYDEHLPLSLTGKGESWVDIGQPYIKSEAIFLCPKDTVPFLIDNRYGRRTSYALNQLYVADQKERLFGAPDSGIRSLSQADIRDASGTVLAGDSSDWFQVTLAPGATTMTLTTDTSPPSFGDGGQHGRFVGRHLNGANWVFLDGHVNWYSLDTIAQQNRQQRYRFFTHAKD
jgi:prepilin-type processing-associated H-X9-DG protein/prepilin-type N-terminal cleavage/methylation domain-containing protein